MIKALFKKRCLEQYRLFDKYWTIAVDATGLASFDERYCDHCLKREYVNKETGEIEKTIYFHYVLEAKLIEDNEEKQFALITNIPIKNAEKILFAGRNRWKIENEGFNNQKNIKNNIEYLCWEDCSAMKITIY